MFCIGCEIFLGKDVFKMAANEKKMLGAVIDEDEIKRRGSAVWPYVHFKPGTPVDPAEIDKLMDGLVDIHVHGAPAGA